MSSNSSMISPRRPIVGPADRIVVQGRYLLRGSSGDGETTAEPERFWMQGMAFPLAPPSTNASDYFVNTTGWKTVLDQLTTENPTLNTVRLYQVNCSRPADYDDFFQHAAALGMYIILPLTTATGDGVLYRTRRQCQRHAVRLARYGQECLVNLVQRHDNIALGAVGNEVLNTAQAWEQASPCVKAYAAALKQSMKAISATATNHHMPSLRVLPLLYAAQQDSPNAAVTADQAMAWTLQYLTCQPNNDINNENEAAATIDVFGINIESWCSSLQTFATQEDGHTESTYHSLWRKLQNSSHPIIFSEMGCSKEFFDRDNGKRSSWLNTTRNGTATVAVQDAPRDWHQIRVVAQYMSDVWSGWVAYAYDGGGNADFRIMGGGRQPWDGIHVLPSHGTKAQPHDAMDYIHLQHELASTVGMPLNGTTTTASSTFVPLCADIEAQIQQAWGVHLWSVSQVPTSDSVWNRFVVTMQVPYGSWCAGGMLVAVLLLLCVGVGCVRANKAALLEKSSNPTEQSPLLPN